MMKWLSSTRQMHFLNNNGIWFHCLLSDPATEDPHTQKESIAHNNQFHTHQHSVHKATDNVRCTKKSVPRQSCQKNFKESPIFTGIPEVDQWGSVEAGCG